MTVRGWIETECLLTRALPAVGPSRHPVGDGTRPAATWQRQDVLLARICIIAARPYPITLSVRPGRSSCQYMIAADIPKITCAITVAQPRICANQGNTRAMP